MQRYGTFAMLFAATLAGLLRAQAPPQEAPEVATQEAPVTFSSRVNLISVPVVVRDRDGHAVGNFRQEDFQLFDKGKPQVITKFSIEKSERPAGIDSGRGSQRAIRPPGPAAPPALPENYVAYLVDDVHLDRGDLLNTRQAMHRHIDESLDPSSRAALFTSSGRMLIDFTADRAKLHDAVNQIQPFTSGIDRAQGCASMSYYVADQLVNQKLYLSGQLFTDQTLIQIIGSGSEPLLSAEYNEAVSCVPPCDAEKDQISKLPLCVVQALIVLRAAARQALESGDRETSFGLGALDDVIRKLSLMPGNRNLVLVSPGFLLTRDHRTHERDIFERAIRANIVINSIDMRGLFAIISGGSAERPPVHSFVGMVALDQADRDAATQSADVLAELADNTGGTFFHNDNDLKGGLNIIAARPEYIYVLGFSPQDLKYDGSYHGLKVTIKNAANLTIQARRGYWAPSHAVDSEEAAREEIQETVFSHDEVRTIPLEVQTEFFESGGGKFDLTVTAQLDAKALRFDRIQDRNDDTVTVVAGLFDPNGNYVAGIQKMIKLHLRNQTLQAFQKAGLSVKEDFNVYPGRYLVRVVVRDSVGNTITARNAGLEIP